MYFRIKNAFKWIFCIGSGVSSGRLKAGLAAVMLFFFMGPVLIQAQVEDTTRTEREGPEQFNFERYESPYNTPYEIGVPESEMNRYRLDDYGTSPGFFRRLEYQGFEEFLMSEEERYDPYDEEWVMRINQDLITLLELTFKEENKFLSAISRIGRFLTVGFFEPYEVPISRVEEPDRSHIESGEHEH